MDKFIVAQVDTDVSPFDPGSYASSSTYVAGMAVLNAATSLKNKIIYEGARIIDPEKYGDREAHFNPKKFFFTGEKVIEVSTSRSVTLDEIAIGCAGGIDTTSAFTYKQEALPAGKFYLRVEVKNLLGGHSGGDIHLGRGNANKLLARFLWLCMQRHEVHLCAIDGGNLRNAIPREAMAVIAVNPEEKEAVRAELNHYAADVAAELSGVDPNVTVDMVTADTPEFMIEDKVARALISALYAAPHGVIAMSHDIEGLVETSTNLASVKMTEPGKIVVATSQRSSVESEKYDIAYQVECLFRLAGAEPSHGDGYPGWKPNMHSRIKDIAVEAYQELYQQTPAIKAIHAGLECGLFLTKYPQLDMISFGPTLRGVHSPDEKMHIPAVEKFWNHLVLILEKVVLE